MIFLDDQIDILVNNAGRSQRAPVLETLVEVDQKIIELNTIGTISLTKLVLPSMVKRKRGQIVVTSSVAGKMGTTINEFSEIVMGHYQCFM